jgi:hypothetical protein
MVKFVEHRVADPRILRLIQKWLNAGVMEEGKWSETKTGSPQGSVISPLLANIYLHYAFDLWVNAWRRKHAQGEVVVIRFADDTIVGFQYQTDADRFLENLRERLGKFGLELHPDKTRRIEFGRFAEQNREPPSRISWRTSLRSWWEQRASNSSTKVTPHIQRKAHRDVRPMKSKAGDDSSSATAVPTSNWNLSDRAGYRCPARY